MHTINIIIFAFNNIIKITLCVILAAGLAHASNDIMLRDPDGEQHLLSDYIGQGKWTVLNVWGPGCPPCLEEMPELVRFHDRHKSDSAIVVGVAIDFPSYGYADRKKVSRFIEDYLIDFPVLLSDASISERIGGGRLQGLPTTFLYTPDGELVAMQVGAITGSVLEDYISRYREKHGDVKNSQ